MNILIITTFFPPDTNIGSVRPYQLAAGLSALGETVTVIRAGIIDLLPSDEYINDKSFELISALGKNCPAEKYTRGERYSLPVGKQNWLRSLPRLVRLPLKTVRDSALILIGKPPKCMRSCGEMLKYQKRAIDRLKSIDRKYDVVFSTCGSFENIYAGRYAAKVFGAKWIMDYRDSMIMHGSMYDDFWWNRYAKAATVLSLADADTVTAVSEGLANELREIYPSKKPVVLYNGFDDKETLPEHFSESGTLSFCYTGRLYTDRLPALKDFADCLSELIKEGEIDRSRIRFCYAGPDSGTIHDIFSKAGIRDILTDKGYLSRTETTALQMSSDIFTLFSWNTKKSKGILTGKFYEGIKTRKPVLAMLTGNAPESELMMLQKRYDYGFCYEQCTKAASMPALKHFITKLYNEKISCGSLSYQPSEELYNAFSYTTLSKKLRGLMYELTDKEIGKK